MLWTTEEAKEKFCPLINYSCKGEGCMWWTYTDGYNDVSYPSSDNGGKGYCKYLVNIGRK